MQFWVPLQILYNCLPGLRTMWILSINTGRLLRVSMSLLICMNGLILYLGMLYVILAVPCSLSLFICISGLISYLGSVHVILVLPLSCVLSVSQTYPSYDVGVCHGCFALSLMNSNELHVQ